MSRRPASDVAVPTNIDGIIFKLATSTLTHLPDAPAFIRACLHKGVSAGIAAEYARIAAKVFREGRAAEPERLIVPNQRTAINAYWRWADEAYELRTRSVMRAISHDALRKGVSRLRVHSLSAPFEGKKILQMTSFPQLRLDGDTKSIDFRPATQAWVDCPAWTLHVPQSDDVPVHQDPCATCTVIALDLQQVEVVAAAFESAWGHRDLTQVAPGHFLFGRPPREANGPVRETPADGRVVALLMAGPLADAVTHLRGVSTRIPSLFVERLQEAVPDVVMISRAAAGNDLPAMLAAIAKAWEVG